MPVFQLPDGPIRLRIRNQSGSKVITGVNIGAKKPDCTYQHADVSPPEEVMIAHGQQMIADNLMPTDEQVDCVCVTLTDHTGVNHVSHCDIEASMVGLVTVALQPTDNMTIHILKLPAGSGEVPCNQSGGHCEGEPS